jgi:hypothetical protein
MDDSRWEFLWVTDFPMFEPTDDGGWTAVHHPFTAPAASHEETFAKDPADVPARAYDLILNGTELGGGSIRIHSSDVQKRVFDVIGLTPGAGERAVRLPARGVLVRPAAARRHRVRHRPHRRDDHRLGLDPRGHRVPEDRRRRRPAHRRADADHRAAAHGGGDRRVPP